MAFKRRSIVFWPTVSSLITNLTAVDIESKSKEMTAYLAVGKVGETKTQGLESFGQKCR